MWLCWVPEGQRKPSVYSIWRQIILKNTFGSLIQNATYSGRSLSLLIKRCKMIYAMHFLIVYEICRRNLCRIRWSVNDGEWLKIHLDPDSFKVLITQIFSVRNNLRSGVLFLRQKSTLDRRLICAEWQQDSQHNTVHTHLLYVLTYPTERSKNLIEMWKLGTKLFRYDSVIARISNLSEDLQTSSLTSKELSLFTGG